MDEERLRFEIATKVLGLEVEQATYDGYEELIDFAEYETKYEMFYWPEHQRGRHPLPGYPYNLSAAWQAVEQLMKQSVEVQVKFGEWFEKVQIWILPEQKAATLICRAILTIYGLQNEKEVDDYSIEEYN